VPCRFRDFFESPRCWAIWIIYSSAQNVLIWRGTSDHSLTLGYYLYNQAFVASRMGYSQAIAVLLLF
jgi:ABC-type sugar transport system permease subunit